jgi:hypothetical protein
VPKLRDDGVDVSRPGLVPSTLSCFVAEVLDQRLATVPVEGSELERHNHAIRDQRRSETGPKPEKEHAAALVAAQRLHDRIVDDANGAIEGAFEVEVYPAAGEVPRFGQRTIHADTSGKAE